MAEEAASITEQAETSFSEPDDALVEEKVYYWGTGRRKTSVARVRIRHGNGVILINRRDVDEYFTGERDKNAVRAPLKAARVLTRYDVFANVKGGGISGQAGAVVLGIARALKIADHGLEPILCAGGYLTRDAREVERKKYGKKKARKSPQYSKR